MKDPLVEALKTATPAQARIIHDVLSGWCEDTSELDPDNEHDAKMLKKLPAAEAMVEKLDAAMASLAGPLTPAEREPLAKQAPAKPKCELKTEFCSGQCIARYKGSKKDDPEFHACIACIAIMKRRGLKVKQVR